MLSIYVYFITCYDLFPKKCTSRKSHIAYRDYIMNDQTYSPPAYSQNDITQDYICIQSRVKSKVNIMLFVIHHI